MAKKLRFYIPIVGPLMETIEKLSETVEGLVKAQEEKDPGLREEINKRLSENHVHSDPKHPKP